MVKDPARNELADPPRDDAAPNSLGWRTGIYGALAAAAGEIGIVPKDRENTAQGFAYRSIETIVGKVRPVLAKHEISIVPSQHEVISSEEVTAGSGSKGYRVVVKAGWRISHSDGSYIDASMLGEAIDYGDKATSKAIQMSYKYLLTQMLGIGSEDPDGDSPDAGASVSTEDQLKQRTNALKAGLYKEAENDADAAASLWDGILDHLGYQEPLKASQITKVEAAINERPS